MEWIIHAVGWLFHDGFHVLHLADPLQTVLHLVPLVFELLLIGNLLHGASAASFRLVAHRLHAVWRWCDELHQSSVGYVLLHLDDLHLRQIAHHGILDKYSHALNVSNALSVIAHVLDEHLIILIFDKCDFTSICRLLFFGLLLFLISDIYYLSSYCRYGAILCLEDRPFILLI